MTPCTISKIVAGVVVFFIIGSVIWNLIYPPDFNNMEYASGGIETGTSRLMITILLEIPLIAAAYCYWKESQEDKKIV